MIPFIAKLAAGPVLRRVFARLPGRYAIGATLLAGALVAALFWWQSSRLDNAREALAESRTEIASLQRQRQALRDAVIEQNARLQAMREAAEQAQAEADYRAREIRRLMAHLRPDTPAADPEDLNAWMRDLFSR